MGYHNVLSLYESVAETTNQMLLAARKQDWDRLSELEGTCAHFVEELAEYNETQLTGEEYKRKLTSIKLILANDREIRNLMAPWMMKLNTMLNTNSKKSSYAGSSRT